MRVWVVQSCDMSTDSETEVVFEKPKRAPRKRAPKVVSVSSDTPAPVKRAPRKRAPKAESEDTGVTEERTSLRKAPTPIAADKARVKRSRRHITVVLTLLLLGIGSSAAVGFTDKGQINVEAVITKRNDEARAAGNESMVIPVQNTPQVPDGGQIGLGDAPSAPTASSTPPAATSTPATASSTESVPEEGVADAATPSDASSSQ
jgi:hypothetical protein